ncbi:MAG: DUF1572 family protein [Planctomycetota bacterium]
MDSNLSNLLSTEFSLQATQLLDQAVVKLEHCLGQLDESQIWWRPKTSLNSIANLLLHMEGNLKQWSINSVTGLPDQRQREQEFLPEPCITKIELWNLVSSTVEKSKQVISSIKAEDYLTERTIQGFNVSLLQAILHTTTHFQGHTHQIIMLTRIIKGDDYQFQWNDGSDRNTLPM